MEARELVRPCVSGGLESEGFTEFTAVAQGLVTDEEGSYRLYLETIFEDVSCELQMLFSPQETASLVWPKRTALLGLLSILNRHELRELWQEDETLGWIYQYFNAPDERGSMRNDSSFPLNSRELAVRNQFFTPAYVVRFLVDNTLGKLWDEVSGGSARIRSFSRNLIRPIDNDGTLDAETDSPSVASQSIELKDPREIKILDPACGSMHFGMYCFDVLEQIYLDAGKNLTAFRVTVFVLSS